MRKIVKKHIFSNSETLADRLKKGWECTTHHHQQARLKLNTHITECTKDNAVSSLLCSLVCGRYVCGLQSGNWFVERASLPVQ
jgi:hypothetical protein